MLTVEAMQSQCREWKTEGVRSDDVCEVRGVLAQWRGL